MSEAGRKPAVRRLIFVCTGNTCRSPMAEALLRARMGDDKSWQITSAGTATSRGSPASRGSIEALRELGIDLTGHRSRPLTAGLIRSADLLVPLALTHFQMIVSRNPAAREKTLLLDSFNNRRDRQPQDVPDPIGGSLDEYRWVRDRIADALEGLSKYLLNWET